MRFDSFESMLGHWAAVSPDRPALRFESGALTFVELEDAVAKRASAILAEGGRCLGVLCDGSADCVIEIFAAARAGLRLALLDGGADEALLRQQIARVGVDWLWGDPELCEDLAPALRPEGAAADGGVLFFTSGTTEAARAVRLSPRSLCASAYNGSALLPLAPEDTLMCMLPLNHVFGFVCGLLWALNCGACVALGRGVRHYADDCAHFRPTALSAVPLLLGFLLKQNALNPELRLILVGAGDCPAPLLQAARMGGRRVSFGYGLTETSSGVALSLGDDPYAMTVCPEARVTIAPDGEVLVHAPTVLMEGYYDDPEAAAAAVRDGVLYTGDLGRLDAEGRLTITGRKKEMLVLRDGTKLFLPEYEGRLAQALGGREFAAIVLDGRPALVLRGDPAERDAVQAQLAPALAALPRGQQPAKLIFVSEPLPRTASGKIKRWEIQQKAGQA